MQLHAEMGVSEAARRAAEAANRAKTQFFAAASHDLRQPLHAMGLFAEALRQRTHDPEVASLVNSINESVDALEGLFGELLDITRIDTGGVEVNPAPVRDARAVRAAAPALRAHRLREGPGAELPRRAPRGASPTRCCSSASCATWSATPSATPTTAACWSAAGSAASKLLLQVWDSGIGISEASLPRIFDEFYQVQSQRPLEAHQRKGLGLGLAIVKRLAGLMEAPISVRSRVGHGTVFSLRGAAGQGGARAGAGRAPGQGAAGPDAAGPADRGGRGRAGGARRPGGAAQGLGRQRAGLRQRGRAAGLAGRRPPTEAPDLLLVDYRLAAGPHRPRRAGRRCARAGRGARCRPSSSPAAPSAATRARPPSTTSTC